MRPEAIRYIGDATIELSINERDWSYHGRILLPGGDSWDFDDLHLSPHDERNIAADSDEAFDKMAASAVSFGSYYTTHNRGRETPDWAPDPEVADAIERAVASALDGYTGEYEVLRDRDRHHGDHESNAGRRRPPPPHSGRKVGTRSEELLRRATEAIEMGWYSKALGYATEAETAARSDWEREQASRTRAWAEDLANRRGAGSARDTAHERRRDAEHERRWPGTKNYRITVVPSVHHRGFDGWVIPRNSYGGNALAMENGFPTEQEAYERALRTARHIEEHGTIGAGKRKKSKSDAKSKSKTTRAAGKPKHRPVAAVVGRPKGKTTTKIQTLIFAKKAGWNAASARGWLLSNGFKQALDETKTSFRARQHDPGGFQKKTFRTISLGKKA